MSQPVNTKTRTIIGLLRALKAVIVTVAPNLQLPDVLCREVMLKLGLETNKRLRQVIISQHDKPLGRD